MSPALVRSTWFPSTLSTLVAVLFAAATVAVAQDAPQMSAEEKAMMEAWTKAATPGKQHQWLATKAGQWELSGRFWNDPSKPPTETKGSVERFLMLGGRVLSERAKSPGFMGQDFEGFGLMGYDNVSQEFWTTWSDTLGTGLMVSKGSCDDKGACTFQGEYADPISGKTKTMRATARDEGPDKEVHEGFEKGPDGKEFKSMELVYTRRK